MIVLTREQVGGVFRGEVTCRFYPYTPGIEQRFKVGRSYSFGLAERVEYATRSTGATRTRAEFRKRGHVIVTLVGRLYLHEITDQAARCAGYPDREALFAFWRERYGDGPGTDRYPTFLPVWVVCFKLDTEHRPRLLGRTGGYVETPGAALRDPDTGAAEPEAVEDHYLELFARSNARRFAQHWREEDARRRRLSLEDRLAELREEARMRGINISSRLRAIKRERDPVKVERYVSAIEELLRAARGELVAREAPLARAPGQHAAEHAHARAKTAQPHEDFKSRPPAPRRGRAPQDQDSQQPGGR